MKLVNKAIMGTASDVKVVTLLLEGLETKEYTGAELLATLCRSDTVCPAGTCVSCPLPVTCMEVCAADWEDYLCKGQNMNTFNHTAHKELWDWLANNPGAFKSEWPGWKDYPDVKDKHNECFACAYSGTVCEDCPLVWPRKKCASAPSDCRSHLFEVWLDRSVALRFMAGKEDSPRIIRRRKAIANIARKIRDLPVREGVECE